MARVLVAEDEAFTALALVDELERLGHQVQEAKDGAVALVLLSTFRPDILVTDLMMPKVDGAALIRSVRGRPAPQIPVILVSGVPATKLPNGIDFDAYLGKPIDYTKLGRTILRLLGR
jgi:CheY-like chemotaxis protein